MDSLVIANLFLLLFLGLADNQMIAALLPSLVKSLGISVSTAGLLVVVYSLAAAVAAFFSGTLSVPVPALRRKVALDELAVYASTVELPQAHQGRVGKRRLGHGVGREAQFAAGKA